MQLIYCLVGLLFTTSIACAGTFNDCSGTIALGGTAQTLTIGPSPNGHLNGVQIANVDATSGGASGENLCVAFNGNASCTVSKGSYPMPSIASAAGMGTYFNPALNNTTVGAVLTGSIVAATTGHVFTCSWW